MIEVNNLTIGKINDDFLKRVAKKVLRGEKIKAKIELSIALIGQKRIQELNRKYRKKNRPTDVLAFAGSKISKSFGEIVICPSVVKKNAKKFKSSFKKELARVLIHGILHLLGYEDEKSKSKKVKMIKKEEYYLTKI